MSLVEKLESRTLLSASLVGDANLDQKSSTVYPLGTVGSIAIYAEADDAHGLELYRSDGTKHGTYFLKDIFPGPKSSEPKFLATTNGVLLFSAYDGTNWRLWKTDGTPQGTVKTTSGSALLNPVQTSFITARIGSVVFYIGRDKKLWRTDGTDAGSKPLTDRILDANGFEPDIAVYNKNVYFAANDDKHGEEVWRTNGTVHGTAFFADLRPGTAGSDPTQFVAASGRLFFTDSNFPDKQHLWKTDGQSVAIVETASKSGGFAPGIHQLTAAGDSLYFSEGGNNVSGSADSVWRTTGKANSLRRVGQFAVPRIIQKAPNTGAAKRIYFYETDGAGRPSTAIYAAKDGVATVVKSNPDPYTKNFTQIGDDLYFGQPFKQGPVNELWYSDGGAARLVRQFSGSNLLNIGAIGGSSAMFMTEAQPGNFDVHVTGTIWKSDGTTNGTVAIKQFPMSNDRQTDFTTNIFTSDRTYFVAEQAPTGAELWVTDGTSAGTNLTRDIFNNHTFDADPEQITAGVGGVYFATDRSGFWIRRDSDGQLVQLVNGDDVFGIVDNDFIGQMNGFEIFGAQNGIWRSDGTPAGTQQILGGDTNTEGVLEFQIVGDTLYFNNDGKLWKSDGTAAGTVELQSDIGMGADHIAFNNMLLFRGTRIDGSTRTHAFWATDGTGPAIKLLDLPDLFVDSGLTPIQFAGKVYFFKRDDDLTRSLWKTDGTPGGTVLVKGGFGTRIAVAVAAGKLFILSHKNDLADEQLTLWTSDGSGGGTTLIKTFEKPIPGDQFNMLAVGNRVYFPARDAKHGFELWTSTGTTNATVLLKDARVGSGDGLRFFAPPNDYTTTDMATDGTHLYFTANDKIHGAELWETDATPSGTHMIEDILPGVGGSWPQHMLVHNNTLFFSAADPIHGRELWQLPLA